MGTPMASFCTSPGSSRPPVVRIITPPRSEHVHELAPDGFLLCQRHMPNAVPSGDEVIGLWRCPLDEVGLMEDDLWMPLTGQEDHFGGNVESLDLKTVASEKFNEPSAATAPTSSAFPLWATNCKARACRAMPFCRSKPDSAHRVAIRS